ncbi:MAG: nucleotide exchange factor GrpE [Candidatus Krumholzibacteriales bacterium]
MKKEETMPEESRERGEKTRHDGEEGAGKKKRDGSDREKSKRAGGKKGKKKGGKGESEKGLLDLLEHKNEMLESMREKIEHLEKQLENKEDRILRMVAEFDNYKKRISREQDLRRDQMYADILRELLPVLDDFDRALEMDIERENAFFEGIRLVYQSFRDILNRMGLTEIEAEGEDFDPRYHEAMGRVESDEGEGRIAYVILKGYKYNDMVVRPARVMVSQGAGTDEDSPE